MGSENNGRIYKKKGIKKSVVSAIAISTLIVATMGIGIASAVTEHPHGEGYDEWTYWSSFNVIKWKKSCHSNYWSIDDHTSTAEVGEYGKVTGTAKSRWTSYACAYGDDGTAKAWYNNTSDVGSVLGF